MYLQLLSSIAPIFLLSAVGFFWARLNYDHPSEFIARIVMNIGAPCLFVSAMSGADINLSELGSVVLAAITVMAIMLSMAAPIIKLLKLPVAVYLPPLLFPNNGNVGLSLCLFSFGNKGLAYGLGIFMLMTVAQFTLGIYLVNNSASSIRARILELAKQPIIYAAALSVTLVATGIKLPLWIDNTVTLMGGITIPLMLITLGASLASLKISNLPRAIIFSSIRLFGGFLLGLFVVDFYQLEGVMRAVVIVQASMPVAVFNYLLAVRYRQSPSETASIVIVSTLMASLLLPLLLAYVVP